MGLSDEQRALRRQGIGASEVAAVVGIDPWRSRADVWAAKCLEGADAITSEPAEWGMRLEPAIVQAYGEKVHPVRVVQVTRRAADEPLALATPDAEHADEPVVVQAKCSSLRMRDEWGPTGTDAVLDHYNCQLQWEMLCSGPEYREAALAVLIGGNEFRHYRVTRDDALIGELVLGVRAFWREYVEPRVPPPLEASTSTATVLALYPAHTPGKVVPWTPQTLALATEYAQHQAAESAAKALKEDVAARIKAAIGDAEIVGDTGKGAKRMTWKTQTTAPKWTEIMQAHKISKAEIDKHKGTTRVLRVNGFGTEE